MSNELTLFGKRSNAALSLLGDIEDPLAKALGNSGGGNKRISIDGGVFREFINGKEVRVSEERAMNVVIVNAAPISRMYFAGAYVKGKVSPPTCWSKDCETPDEAVPVENRQSANCRDCRQHVKGSAAAGEGRACRFQQRLAVVLESEIDKQSIHQITLPSTSIFGDAEGNKMPLQAYSRYLKAHNTHAISIVTEMRFDLESSVPKLVFKPVRALEDAELENVIPLREHPDAVKAITLTVSQMDGVTPKAKELPPPPKQEAKPLKAVPKAAPVEVEAVEEPVKVTKKSAPPAVKDDIADIVGNWDD